MSYYSPSQTFNVLKTINVDVVGETDNDWLALCPFHNNTESAAFSVKKDTGAYWCFNGACGAYGNGLDDLVQAVTKESVFYSARLINKVKSELPFDTSEIVARNILDEPEPMPEFPQEEIDRMHKAFFLPSNKEVRKYMSGRGFTKETMEHFQIGWNEDEGLVTVPMYSIDGDPVGYIGRSIDGKRFKNSPKLPKKQTLFNIHNGKKNPVAVVTEASFDAMMVWQASGAEAVATIGSSLGNLQAAQLDKYFTRVVIMTDDDQKLFYKEHCRKCKVLGAPGCIGHNTGEELGQKIASSITGVETQWAHLDSLKRFDGKKDACDMTPEEIRYAIKNAISNFEMNRQINARS